MSDFFASDRDIRQSRFDAQQPLTADEASDEAAAGARARGDIIVGLNPNRQTQFLGIPFTAQAAPDQGINLTAAARGGASGIASLWSTVPDALSGLADFPNWALTTPDYLLPEDPIRRAAMQRVTDPHLGEHTTVGQWFEDQQKAALDFARDIRPDLAGESEATLLIAGFAEVLVPGIIGGALGGPLGAALAMGGSSFETTQQSLLDQGADAQTAVEGATIEGFHMFAGGLAPMGLAGKLFGRFATGAGLNAMLGAAERYSMNEYLTGRGYGEGSANNLAEQYNWADTHAMLIDIATGGFFNAWLGHRVPDSVAPHEGPAPDRALPSTPQERLQLAFNEATAQTTRREMRGLPQDVQEARIARRNELQAELTKQTAAASETPGATAGESPSQAAHREFVQAHRQASEPALRGLSEEEATARRARRDELAVVAKRLRDEERAAGEQAAPTLEHRAQYLENDFTLARWELDDWVRKHGTDETKHTIMQKAELAHLLERREAAGRAAFEARSAADAHLLPPEPQRLPDAPRGYLDEAQQYFDDGQHAEAYGYALIAADNDRPGAAALIKAIEARATDAEIAQGKAIALEIAQIEGVEALRHTDIPSAAWTERGTMQRTLKYPGVPETEHARAEAAARLAQAERQMRLDQSIDVEPLPKDAGYVPLPPHPEADADMEAATRAYAEQLASQGDREAEARLRALQAEQRKRGLEVDPDELQASMQIGAEKTIGSEVDVLTAVGRRAFGKAWGWLQDAGIVNLYESFDALPADLQARAHASFGANAKIVEAFVTKEGRAYFIADRIAPQAFVSKVLHEVGVHLGMDRMLGPKTVIEINRQLARMVAEGHPVVTEAMNQIKRDSGVEMQAIEGLAYTVEIGELRGRAMANMIEGRMDLPIVDRVLSYFRQWAVKTFGYVPGMKLTVDDLREMAVGALRKQAIDAQRAKQDVTALPRDTRSLLQRMLGAPDLLATFGGPRARTANHETRRLARHLERRGYDEWFIWHNTGWGRGDDGHWRFLIPDKDAAFAIPWEKLRRRKGDMAFADVFHHPALIKAYPQLLDVRVRIVEDTRRGGSWDPETGIIELHPKGGGVNAREAMLHEITHAIQDIEGFAAGADWETLTNTKQIAAVREFKVRQIEGYTWLSPQRRAEWIKQLDDKFETYLYARGEAEARAVERQREEEYGVPPRVLTRAQVDEPNLLWSPTRNNWEVFGSGRRNANGVLEDGDVRPETLQSPSFRERLGRVQESVRNEDAGGAGGAERGVGRGDDAGAKAGEGADGQAVRTSKVKDGEAADPRLVRQTRQLIGVSGIRLESLAGSTEIEIGTYRLRIDLPFSLTNKRLRDALTEPAVARSYNAVIDFDIVEKGVSLHDPTAPEGRGDGVYLRWASVPDALQGSWLGTWFYRQMIDWAHRRGLTFYSDASISAKAWPMYERLKELGYDVQRQIDDKLRNATHVAEDENTPIFAIRPSAEDAPAKKPYDAAPRPEGDYQLDADDLLMLRIEAAEEGSDLKASMRLEAADQQKLNGDHDHRVSPRQPDGKAATEDPLSENLGVHYDVVLRPNPSKKVVEWQNKLSAFVTGPIRRVTKRKGQPDIVRDTTSNIPPVEGETTHQTFERYINHARDNLLWLHDMMPEHIRARAKLWYDGGRRMVTAWAQRYDLPDYVVAGVIATQSPQKDWFINMSLAERIIDVFKFQQSFAWTPEMQATADRIFERDNPKHAPIRDRIDGKSITEILEREGEDGTAAVNLRVGAWIRVFDETYNDPGHRMILPEGELGPFMTNNDGSRTKIAWGSNLFIAKAVSILRDHGRENLSDSLGTQHKVRSFHNNLVAPNAPHGDTTADTHQVAALLVRPLSGSTKEVDVNLNGGPNTSELGLIGSYVLNQEAVTRAANERGLLPREMQSITWEIIRAMFPDTWKTEANSARVDALWEKHYNGEATVDDTLAAIFRIAGGVTDGRVDLPAWAGEGVPATGLDAGRGHSTYEGELPGLRLAGRSAGPVDSGAGGRGAADVAEAGGGLVGGPDKPAADRTATRRSAEQVEELRKAQQKYDEQDPVQQALGNKPDMLGSMSLAEGRLPRRAVDELAEARAETESAQAMDKAFTAAAGCAAKQAARSFISIAAPVTRQAAADVALGQFLGLTASVPVGIIVSNTVAQRADPRGYALRRAETARQNWVAASHRAAVAAGLDEPSGYDLPDDDEPVDIGRTTPSPSDYPIPSEGRPPRGVAPADNPNAKTNEDEGQELINRFSPLLEDLTQ